MRLRIAIRNTFRNRRRTALNVFMIAAGVVSLVLFKGFSSHMILTVREGMIKSEFGHLQIAQTTFWDQNAENPRANLLPRYQALLEELKKNPDVDSVSGRTTFFGLVGNRDRSVAAQIWSLDPEREKFRLEEIKMVEGTHFDRSSEPKILLGIGLAQSIRAKVGESLNLLGYTYDGVVNGFDMELAGIFQTGYTEIDNMTAIVSLENVQKLLDTDSVEKVIIRLKDTSLTERNTPRVVETTVKHSPTLAVRVWHQLAKLYREVAAFYAVYDTVMQVIILSLVLIGILNTIGMSIFERTGEIGTMRALGETEGEVIRQFLLEGAVLGVIGGTSGVLAGFIIARVVNTLAIPMIIPGASSPVPIFIDLSVRNFLEALLLTLLTSVVAAAIPAFRATKLNIADALRRNI